MLASEVAAEARSLIAGYISHLEDATYVSAVLALAPLTQIDHVLATMLRRGDRDEHHSACTFIRDLAVIRDPPMLGLVPAFRHYLPHSESVKALRANLYAPDYNVRNQSVHTLGATGRNNIGSLLAALPWYLEHDPFNVSDVVGELFWLGVRKSRQALYGAMTSAPLYLTRWAAVDHLCSQFPRPSRWQVALLERLAEDVHPLMRAEAVWRLAELRRPAAKRLLPPTPPDIEGGFVREEGEPDLIFQMVRLHLGNYLHVSGRADYDLALAERLIAYLHERPPSRGMDLEVYWRAFDDLEAGRR